MSQTHFSDGAHRTHWGGEVGEAPGKSNQNTRQVTGRLAKVPSQSLLQNSSRDKNFTLQHFGLSAPTRTLTLPQNKAELSAQNSENWLKSSPFPPQRHFQGTKGSNLPGSPAFRKSCM